MDTSRSSRSISLRVQKFLGGLRYPTGKSEVLSQAELRGADAHVMRALLALPARSYESPIDLSREIARHAERTKANAAYAP